MRILRGGAIGLLLIGILLVFAASPFADTDSVPQVYTHVLRQISGQTETVVTFKTGISSFDSVTTNAAYRIGPLTLTHYKLLREPISKFAIPKRTYEYVTLESNVTIKESDGVSGKITFYVSKAWIESVGGKSDQIALFLFEDDEWKKLDTKLSQDTGINYVYDAYTNNFGYFAIAIDRPLQNSASTSASAPQPSATSGGSITSGTSTQATPQPLEQSPSTSSAPESVDPQTAPVEVVYPLLDSDQSSNAFPLQQLIGYGLLFLAVTGIIGVGVAVVQSRVHRAPQAVNPSTSVNDLLAQLQSARQTKLKPATTMSSDVNALLQKVHARYQPAMPKASLTTPFTNGVSSIASSLSHSIDDLKSRVADLEPDLVKRYTQWSMDHGHDISSIRADLLSHDIDESVVNRVLSEHWKRI